MPRFTLRQLLTGVFLGCVYLAVLRDMFTEGTHDAVAIVTWVILAIFYGKWRSWFSLAAHSAAPLAVLSSSLYLLVVSGFPSSAWRFHVFDESVQVLVVSCRFGSVVIFPLAIAALLARYLKNRRNSPSGTEST